MPPGRLSRTSWAAEKAWNSGAGARPFTEDADFVNIRGEHLRTRDVVANGHQVIFNSIYKGSVVRYLVSHVRAIAPDVLVAHAKSTLNAPTGPLAGEHRSLFTLVLVQDHGDWRIAAFHNTLVSQRPDGPARINTVLSQEGDSLTCVRDQMGYASSAAGGALDA